MTDDPKTESKAGEKPKKESEKCEEEIDELDPTGDELPIDEKDL